MTDLECLIEWLKTYDGYDILGSCQVDYTDQIPNQGFVFPQLGGGRAQRGYSRKRDANRPL